MVTWKKNLFLLPSGGAGKKFIKLVKEWLSYYNIGNSFQGISLKVIAVLPNLMLQKPSAKSKSKDHSEALESRLQLWSEGNIMDILRECTTIQTKLKSGKKRSTEDITRIFSNLIFEGKFGAALKFLDEHAEDAVLPSSESVTTKLKLLRTHQQLIYNPEHSFKAR